MRVLVVDRTGLIRRHSPKAVQPGRSWCPMGGTMHPDWRERLA